MKITTNNYLETKKFGENFAKKIHPGEIVCLYGNLGTGKTTFAQGLVKGFGVEKRVISPTFIIIRSYETPLKKKIYHVDLYRLKGEEDLDSTGLLDIINNDDSIIAIEWPEKMGKFLPKNRWEVRFEYIGQNKREITIDKS